MKVIDALILTQSSECEVAMAHTRDSFRSREHRGMEEHTSLQEFYTKCAVESAERAEALGWLIDNLPTELAEKII